LDLKIGNNIKMSEIEANMWYYKQKKTYSICWI